MILVAILAVVVAILLFIQSAPGKRALRAAGLSQHEAPYFELYFPSAASLGEDVPGTGRVRVSFVIFNAGLTSRMTKWRIVENDGVASRLRLDQGTAEVGARGRKAVRRTVPVSCGESRVQIAISLSGTPDTITRWLACTR